MVDFVGVEQMQRWILDTGVERLIGRLSDYVEADYRRWQSFERIPRIASHTPFGVIELMPTSDADSYAVKYVNGHPSNPGRGYQTVVAFGVLAETLNGYPVLISEMTLLTALRTAATSAVAARHLARPESRRMAMIGSGSQAEFQALAFRAALGIEELSIWDVDPAAMDKFERNLAPLGFRIERAASGADAVRGADVVTTCTADKAFATVLHAGDIRPGLHINAIGGDCPGKAELDPAILRLADVFVEFTPQTRIEGEIQQMPEDFPVTELWEVVQERVAGRTTAEQITVFDSVGFAIQDFSALRFVHDEISGSGYVSDLDLLTAPEDPKDLFGLVAARVPVA